MAIEVPLTRRHFQQLAELRAREAAALAKAGEEAGAYYLVGYAVECALKACIAKRTKQHEFPPRNADKFYTHNLVELLKLAELDKKLEMAMKKNATLAKKWNTVQSWKENSRYTTKGLKGADLHTAITGTDGVLAWIKKYW